MLFERVPIDVGHLVEQVALRRERIHSLLMGHSNTFPEPRHLNSKLAGLVLSGPPAPLHCIVRGEAHPFQLGGK